VSFERSVAAGALLALAGCGPGAGTLPSSVAQLTCTVEQESGNTWAHFNAEVTGGPDVRYQASVDYGDGAVETRTVDVGRTERFSHQYAGNGRYAIQATLRNVETNDRLTCGRTVDFDVCRSAEVVSETFDSGGTLFWRREVVSDSPSIRESMSWLGSGGNPGGFRTMTHEFTATTSPAFVSIFVHHVFTFGGPKPGPIDRIRYREDRIKLAPLTATSAVGAGALIVQGGVYHVAPLAGGQFSNQGWERVEAVLRASDFTPPPDFSRGAEPMRFGYVRSNSNRFPLLIEHGIDNWRVEICR
jgi:hypothetical protein